MILICLFYHIKQEVEVFDIHLICTITYQIKGYFNNDKTKNIIFTFYLITIRGE